MPRINGGRKPVLMLGPPYRHLKAVSLADPARPQEGGWVLTWNLGSERWSDGEQVVADRLAGTSLVIILPDGNDRLSVLRVLRLIERTRPQAVLPHHEGPSPREIASVVRRPPTSLASSVTDYLEWRGIPLDPGTRNIVRRTLELSDRIQTITALARHLYMSRRALGRRLLGQGLPVPSHWLQIARILRVAIKLQNSDASLFSAATSLGYPDGFSLSNQMKRLCGVRPLEARRRLGWEWLFETWLAREAGRGTLAESVFRARPSIAGSGPPDLGGPEVRSPSSAASL